MPKAVLADGFGCSCERFGLPLVGTFRALYRLLKESEMGVSRGLKSAKKIKNKRLRRWDDGQALANIDFFSSLFSGENGCILPAIPSAATSSRPFRPGNI
jgi:hypothetical protein